MQNQLFDAYNEMTQSSFETLRKLGEINMKAGERLFQQQLELTNTMMETSARSMELMGKAKGYQELVSTQAKLSQDAGHEYLKSYRSTVEVLAEARDATAELLDKQMQEANRKAQEAGEELQKAGQQFVDQAQKAGQRAAEQTKKAAS